MHKKLIVIFIGLVLLIGGGTAGAEETLTSQPVLKKRQAQQTTPNSSKDKEIELKKAAIIKIMSQGVFKAYIQDNKKFCSAFLEDFKKQKNIEYVRPIVEADDYNDPKLQTYFMKCPREEFHKTVWAETLSQMRSCDEGDEPCGIIYYATKNFKLFKVDMDNTRNRDEYVLYAEGYKNSIGNYTYGGYTILDLNKCESSGSVNTRDPYDYKKQTPIENYNGIIRYKGTYYVFDLYEYRWLKVEKYMKNINEMNSFCEYRLEK